MLLVDDCIDKNKGFFLCGDSGSGKTSVAGYIATIISNKKPNDREKEKLINPVGAECIVLDIHNNPIWYELGLKVIYKPEEIINWLVAINEEYENRKAGKKGNRLIVFLDEVGELLIAVRKLAETDKEARRLEKIVTDTIQTLASGGRKFFITLIAMNQSMNCSAIGIDGSYRNNFIGLLLCAEARKYAELKWQQSDNRYQYVMKNELTAYPVIGIGAITPQLIKHPTHHSYKTMNDGDTPLNLKPINLLTLSLTLQLTLTPETSQDKHLQRQSNLISQVKQAVSDGKSQTFIIEKILKKGGRYYEKGKEELEDILKMIS